MTDCNRLKDHLYDYVDDVLPNEPRKRLEQHLQHCPDCEAVFQNLMYLKNRLKTLKPLKTSSDFDMILRTRIKMERSLNRGRFANWPVKLPIYAASAALVILAAFFVFDYNSGFRGGNQGSTPSQFAGAMNTGESTQAPESVVFPMEVMSFNNSGAAINSENLRLKQETLADSSRGRSFESNVKTVEF